MFKKEIKQSQAKTDISPWRHRLSRSLKESFKTSSSIIFRQKASNMQLLMQLIHHYEEILNNLNEGYETCHLSDKMDHTFFLPIACSLQDWIKSFLTNWSQRVVVDGQPLS